MGGAIGRARLRRGSGHRSERVFPQPAQVRLGGHATAQWHILFYTTPELAANSAITLGRAKAAGRERRNVSGLGAPGERIGMHPCRAAILVPFKRVLRLSLRRLHVFVTNCSLAWK